MEFYQPLAGGILIGLGSLLAMAVSGKVPGISGVASRIFRWNPGDTAWRIVFLAGLILGAGLMFYLFPNWQSYSIPSGRSIAVFAVAGILVGFGTRMGGGCTSGHGVCGIGSGARDAVVYTLVFMATGVATAILSRLIWEGGAG